MVCALVATRKGLGGVLDRVRNRIDRTPKIREKILLSKTVL